MIFVTVGTNEAPFDRLVEAVAMLETTETLVVQRGASAVSVPGSETVDFLPFDDLVEHVRSARLVVTHAGVGSTIVALSNGKRPIVVPRLKRYGEAVDDHQVQFGQRFADAGLVTFVPSPAGLGQALDECDPTLPALGGGAGPLAADIRGFIETRVMRTSAADGEA